MMLEEDQILWDVVEEHLDESEFLVERWRSARRSPVYTLEELRDGPESRLLAHTDGIVVNGPVALEKLAWAEVQGSHDAMRIAASALAMFDGGDFRPLDAEDAPKEADDTPVIDPDMPEELLELEALPPSDDDDLDDDDQDGDGDQDAAVPVEIEPSARAEGLALALALSSHPQLSNELRARCGKAGGPQLTMLLEACADRGLDPGAALERGLVNPDPITLAAAIRAAAHADPTQLRAPIESMLQHPSPLIQTAALDTSLRWGSPVAWQAALYAYKAPHGASAMVWLACLGNDGHAKSLGGLLSDPSRRHDALWALGFSGRVCAVDACMPWLDDEDDRTRRLAGEAVAAIIGLDPDDDTWWEATPTDEPTPGVEGDDPSDDQDDFEAELGLEPEDELPLPNAEAIRAHWAQARTGFTPGERYILGQPVDERAGPGWALSRLPCRRLDVVAREIVARSQGVGRWPGRAASRRHLQAVDGLAKLSETPGTLRGPSRY